MAYGESVARWQANPQERLARAALELFADRGYDATTVLDIVERAGLTRSTFFRHFTDKREVLFGGQEDLTGALSRAVAEAPSGATPREYLQVLSQAMVRLFDPEALALAATRAAVIRAHVELRERDLLKRAQLETALAALLVGRDVDGVTARLAAALTLWSFDTALDRWVDQAQAPAFERLLAEAVQEIVQRAAALDAPGPGTSRTLRGTPPLQPGQQSSSVSTGG